MNVLLTLAIGQAWQGSHLEHELSQNAGRCGVLAQQGLPVALNPEVLHYRMLSRLSDWVLYLILHLRGSQVQNRKPLTEKQSSVHHLCMDQPFGVALAQL